jgi:hypothetical protein
VSPYFPSVILGGENSNVRFILGSMRHHFGIFKIAFLFYTIQNKSEKNIHAMIIRRHTCKSKLNLFFLEPYLQLLQRDFTNQDPPVSSSSSFSSVDTYLMGSSFEYVTCNPPPPNFSMDLASFREWFLWRLGGGAVAPPGYAIVRTPFILCRSVFISQWSIIMSDMGCKCRYIDS